jgi:hypothetical protein
MASSPNLPGVAHGKLPPGRNSASTIPPWPGEKARESTSRLVAPRQLLFLVGSFSSGPQQHQITKMVLPDLNFSPPEEGIIPGKDQSAAIIDNCISCYSKSAKNLPDMSIFSELCLPFHQFGLPVKEL